MKLACSKHACSLCLFTACATSPAADANDWTFGDDGSGKADGSTLCTITSVPASLNLDAFYTKYCSATGLAIVSSSKAPDSALHQAQRLIDALLAPHPDVRASMIAQDFHFMVLATSEQTTDLPEERGQPDTLNQRARGLYNPGPVPNSFAAEENILCYERDGWYGENILVHEFGHALKGTGFQSLDPTFEGRVQAAFDAAKAAGKYVGLYAGTNPEEYWAEGMQNYFNVHQMNDPGDIHTKADLAAYDPTLYAILDEKFHDVQLPGPCPRPGFATTSWYRLENVALGSGTALDAGVLHPTANVSGEYWHLASNGDGTFRLTNMFQGDGQSLDVANDGVYEPVMAGTGNYTGQSWTVTPITTGEYRLTSVFQPTLSLAASGDALVNAPKADVPEQAWTIRRIP
jgi:hypothetical protein